MKVILAWGWYAVGAAVLLILVAGLYLGHSDSFRQQCSDHLVTGRSIGWFKNLVCDAGFEIG